MNLLRIASLGAAALSMVADAVGKPVVIGYYPSWKRAKMDGVDFSKYTHMNLAFSIPKADGTFSFEDDWAMQQIMKPLRAAKVKVLMSVGGWTGSNHFSNIVKSQSSKDTMIKSMVDYVKANELDGIDIDWEYPGRLGNDCNAYDAANDSKNFLEFLKSLRSQFDSTFGQRAKLITLAVRVQPFDGPSGLLSDVSAFAKVVDYANLMQYDINGGWSNVTGPNAPFNFEKGKGTQLSFVSAIDEWTKAGWPANQLTAGIGFYGRSTTALDDMTKDPNNQYQPQSKEVPLGDSEDAPWYDACAKTTSNSGTWQWKHLRDQGVLTSPTTAAAPWVRQWDSVTQTPWLFNPTTKKYLSYDDPQSVKVKVDYAASKGLAGVMVWSVNMDYNNELMNVIHQWPGGGGGAGTSPAPAPSTTPANSQPGYSTCPKLSGSPTSAPTPTASPTASPTVSPSPPGGGGNGGITAGSPCSSEGAYQCADSTGKNTGYFVCLHGKWTPQSCGTGTACFQWTQTAVSCSWPLTAWLGNMIPGVGH